MVCMVAPSSPSLSPSSLFISSPAETYGPGVWHSARLEEEVEEAQGAAGNAKLFASPTVRTQRGLVEPQTLSSASALTLPLTLPQVRMEGLDTLYLKNILVKFLEAAYTDASAAAALLPVLATLLQFSPSEFKATQAALHRRGSLL